MLPRSARLRRTSEIQRVLREGQCLNTPYARICTALSPTPHTRVACVVGKSVHRSAVQRHRYQRWLREVAEQWLAGAPSATPHDMVWIAQPGIVEVRSLAELTANLSSYLEKLRLKLAS